MVSAEFTYREFLPAREMPSDVTNLTFGGSEEIKKALNTLKSSIQFDCSRLSDYEIGIINQLRGDVREKLATIQQQMAEIKKSNRFMMVHKGEAYARYQELEGQMNSLVDQDDVFVDKIEALDEDRFYTPKRLADKYAELLSSLGFETKGGKTDERGVRREHFESVMSEEELMSVVLSKTAELQEQLDARKLELLVKYGLPIPTMTAEETTSYSNAQGEDTLSGAVEGVSSIDNGLDFEEDGM